MGSRTLAWTIGAYDADGHWIGPLVAGRPFRVVRAVDTVWMEIESDAWGGAPASGVVHVYGVDLLIAPPPRPTPVPTAPPPPPAAPPVVQPVQAAPAALADCDPAAAPYVVHRQVGAFGSVDGCSYVSAEQAEANADQLEAALRANAALTQEARATPTAPVDERGRQ